jgi:hypothetical protein
MTKKYYCKYHPKVELDEAGECPECEKELMEYGRFRSGEGQITKRVKALLNRSGVKC